jgi:hypothetical protein
LLILGVSYDLILSHYFNFIQSTLGLTTSKGPRKKVVKSRAILKTLLLKGPKIFVIKSRESLNRESTVIITAIQIQCVLSNFHPFTRFSTQNPLLVQKFHNLSSLACTFCPNSSPKIHHLYFYLQFQNNSIISHTLRTKSAHNLCFRRCLITKKPLS